MSARVFLTAIAMVCITALAVGWMALRPEDSEPQMCWQPGPGNGSQGYVPC